MTDNRPRKRPLSRRLRRATRPLRYGLVMPVLKLLTWLMRVLPHGVVLAIGRNVGRLAWWVAVGARRTAERQLIDAGVAADRREAARLARGVFVSLGMTELEWLHVSGWDVERFRECVRFDGLEHYREARSVGRGLVVVSAHFGNWELMPTGGLAHVGEPFHFVMSDRPDDRLNEWIVAMRERHGHTVLFNSDGALPMLRALRRDGVLGAMVDLDSTRGRGLFVEFFGRPAYTSAGAAFLARQAGCAVLPVVVQRDAADPRQHVVRAFPAIWPDPGREAREDLQRMTQAYTRVIETQIRRRPEQWIWMHRRWLHQPGEEIPVRAPRRRRPKAVA